LLLVVVLTGCTQREPEQSLFDQQLDCALALAQEYGPITEAIAQQAAEEFNGVATEINYKSPESAERKCLTDSCMPFDLKDLARTTVVATWDSADVGEVIEYLITITQEQELFGRYKHQTSDYGYWGDIVNLQFDSLMTEIQVKTYGMFYAADPEEMVRETIGDERYEYIYSVTGVEPGMAHVYYEIIRADTSSEATIAHYKQLSREYFRILQSIPKPDE
jgi:hypothetical protein